MPDLALAQQIARTLYQIDVESVESLDPHPSDRRGLYRIQTAHAQQWLLRLLPLPTGLARLTQMTQILAWLAHQHFPVPAVRATADQQPVGIMADWAAVVLTYIEGDVLGRNATDLGGVASLLGQLHTLGIADQQITPPSRCHPINLETAIQQLATYGDRAPPEFRPLVADLHTSMLALQPHVQSNLRITHGDCWYANAIKTPDNRIVLIDWDLAGIGHPLLELGNLLLTSHFDFSQPLTLTPDKAIIREIMRGYQTQCRFSQADQENLADAMRYLLAYQLGSYLADETRVVHPEFPFVLRKLQARYQVTQAIAEVAVLYMD